MRLSDLFEDTAVTVWHVTTFSNLLTIVKQGLRCNARKNFADHELSNEYYDGARSTAIFVTSSKDEAEKFYTFVVSKAHPDSELVILKIRIPGSDVKFLQVDHHDIAKNKAKHAMFFTKDIPPSWILGAEAKFGPINLKDL